jgi:hypothetical protein
MAASTIVRAEATPGVPQMQAPNLFRIQRALEIGDRRKGGVIFIDPDDVAGAGVRLRQRDDE